MRTLVRRERVAMPFFWRVISMNTGSAVVIAALLITILLVLGVAGCARSQGSGRERGDDVLQGVLSSIKSIQSPTSRALLMARVAEAYAGGGQRDRARALAQDAAELVKAEPDELDKVFVLDAVAVAYSKSGYRGPALVALARAIEVARNVDAADKQVGAVPGVARTYADIAEFDWAVDLVRDLPEAEALLSGFARRMVEAGQIDRALQLGRKLANFSERDAVMVEVARGYAVAGRKKRALAVIDEATGSYGFSHRNDANPQVLVPLAEAYAAVGQKSRALKLLAQARKAAQGQPQPAGVELWEPELGPGSKVDVARVYRLAGDRKTGMSILAEVLKSARSIDASYARAMVLVELAEEYRAAGRIDEAALVMDEALASAEKADVAFSKTLLLVKVAGGYARAGRVDKALEVLDTARETAKTVNKSQDRAGALVLVGAQYLDPKKDLRE